MCASAAAAARSERARGGVVVCCVACCPRRGSRDPLPWRAAQALATEHRLQKARVAQLAWHARRNAENEARAAGGLALLPAEPEAGNPTFKPLAEAESDRLEILLHSAQVASYCEAINSFAGKGFGKLFLAGALHTEL